MSLTYNEAVEQTITAGEQIHQIVNGTATTEVTVEDGSKVPSIRKALLDNFYFKDPIAWQVGQTENVFNQLRQFTDGSWWYAPSATASNPISMGSTPVGNPLWKIYDFDAIGKLEPRIDEALRRSYAGRLVDGSFEVGGTLDSASDVIIHEATGKAYSWGGPFPKQVLPGSGVSGYIDKSNGLLNRRFVTTVDEVTSGTFKPGDFLELSDRGWAKFRVVAGISNGIDKIDAGNGNVAELQDVHNLALTYLGSNNLIDCTDILNRAFEIATGRISLGGVDVACNGEINAEESSSVYGLDLFGAKLTISSGVFNIKTQHSFTIDLGGGEIDLGLKKAQLLTDAPNGNVFNVVDASEFNVGDVVTCSFDLNRLPNDTKRSTLPGGVLNTIQSISGNQITMKYTFAANGGGGAPGYTSIPAGAWIINSVFTKAGIYYTGSKTFAMLNGNCGKSSAGTVVAVNNTEATFWSQQVDYDEAGLDMTNLRCKNIVFDGFRIGTSYDIAKQGIVPEWSGLLSMSKGKFKRNNFDGEFYLPYGSQLGDMYLSEVEGDGGYDGGIITGAFSGNSLFVGKFTNPNLKLRSLKLDRCKFKNYQRNGFGSGDDVVVTAKINEIEISNSTCNVPWLRTTFSNPNTLVSSDFIKISGGAMGCSLSYRQNAGFTGVNYDGVDLIAAGVVRYLNCKIDNCRFNGGSHVIDSTSIFLGDNDVVNSGKVLIQNGTVAPSSKLRVPSFKASDASGTFFPITNFVDSSLGEYYPTIEIVVPDFAPLVRFGNANTNVRYTIELVRTNENAPPFDCKSRHAVYIVAGSTIKGLGDSTLYKSTASSTSVMSANYPAGTVNITQNNSGTLPSVGDIFAVLYANDIVGYHRITSASGNSFTINPGLREAITTTTLCGLNKLTKVY